MRRRTVLAAAGTAALLTLPACLDSDGQTNNEGQTDDRPSCSLHVELVDDPPENATVVNAVERQLLSVELIGRVFDRVTDPGRERQTTTRPSGTYEVFTVAPDSATEIKAAQRALSPLPTYRGDGYPPGVYVEHGGVTAAITEDCLTSSS